MPDFRRIITGPLRIRSGLGVSDLSCAVAADAIVRRLLTAGAPAELVLTTQSSDLSSQYAFERELARDGHDRSSLNDSELGARERAFVDERTDAANSLLTRLGVAGSLEDPNDSDAARAARTAFVRLYEEGLVDEMERVVATCPRCHAAVDGADIEVAQTDGELLAIRMATGDGLSVDVSLVDPELLPGVVAVAVPPGDASPGGRVEIPIAARVVSIVADATCARPWLVVPAHDPAGHALAQMLGLKAIPVLDADGVVCADGPLTGLGRYAAREAARELLAAEGVLVGAGPSVDVVSRCRHCGTALVPLLGRHWFLHTADLDVVAADAVRSGEVSIAPSDARDLLMEGAGERGEWCVSSQVVGGVALPAAQCLECEKLTVDVELRDSCGKCMGLLVTEPAVLDGGFVAAIRGLVAIGWPHGRVKSRPRDAAAIVRGDDVLRWLLPCFALGLRLTGEVPFRRVVVHPWPDVATFESDEFVSDEDNVDELRLALAADAEESLASLVESMVGD